jgi:hypothetical protein
VIPDKILKAAAEKGSKAPRVAAGTSAAVTQAESKKRKDGEGSKAVPKRRKVAKAAADSAEEVAKSGQGASENAPGGPARCTSAHRASVCCRPSSYSGRRPFF